VLQLTTQVTR